MTTSEQPGLEADLGPDLLSNEELVQASAIGRLEKLVARFRDRSDKREILPAHVLWRLGIAIRALENRTVVSEQEEARRDARRVDLLIGRASENFTRLRSSAKDTKSATLIAVHLYESLQEYGFFLLANRIFNATVTHEMSLTLFNSFCELGMKKEQSQQYGGLEALSLLVMIRSWKTPGRPPTGAPEFTMPWPDIVDEYLKLLGLPHDGRTRGNRDRHTRDRK